MDIMLASSGYFGGYSGGVFGNVLAVWEQLGVFSYILPFLLIFAIVFGVLMQVKLFKENRVINGIIALSVSLLSLQFDFVPIFFSEIFPRLGVGLAVLLVILILFGLFLDPKHKGINYVLLGGAVIILIVVIYQTFSFLGYGSYSGFLWMYSPYIVGSIIFLAIIGAIIGAGKEKTGLPDYRPILYSNE